MHLENSRNAKSCSIITAEYQALTNQNNRKPKSQRESNAEIRKKTQDPYKKDIQVLLLDLCGLLNEGDSKNSSLYISEFKKSLTLEYLYEAYKDNYVDPCNEGTFNNGGSNSFRCLPRLIYENNLQNITNRIDLLDNTNYCYYESYHSKPNMIKGVEAHHDNDILMLIPDKNQDREYTGGFKFSFVTDYFKWRFLKFGGYPEKVLSYQAISLGGTGYTPYIRYRNNFELADSIHSYDRPFGSYVYIERAKYRTWRKGLIRNRGEFQIGSIGISQGRKIQAKLHEDVNHNSQFVYGWGKQIGDGGRLVFQFSQKWDFLLFSTSNNYSTVFKPRTRYVVDRKKHRGTNIILETDLRWGGYYTSAGLGLRYSTIDLLGQSGTNQILPKSVNSKNEFGWKFDFGVNYRYVIHNTMLEGLGYFKTFPQDAYDKVNPDHYVLEKDQIQRNLIILDFGFNFRWRKTTLYYRWVFHTLEYNSAVSNVDFRNSDFYSTIDPKDVDFYYGKVVKEHNSFLNGNWFNGDTYYGYGTIGLSWIIE